MTVEHPEVIDIVTHDPHTNEAILVAVEHRPWSAITVDLSELRAKMGLYVAFVLDGRLDSEFPALAEKNVHIQLRSSDEPPQQVIRLLRELASRCQPTRAIRFSWRIIGQADEHGV